MLRNRLKIDLLPIKIQFKSMMKFDLNANISRYALFRHSNRFVIDFKSTHNRFKIDFNKSKKKDRCPGTEPTASCHSQIFTAHHRVSAPPALILLGPNCCAFPFERSQILTLIPEPEFDQPFARPLYLRTR